jgi:DNA-binding transcriptional LysR family regulator
MEIDLNRMRHIAAVARLRSFSRAAEELHITQPALSRSIAAFEERFGVRLFDRGRGGVMPTPVGVLVVAEAERLLGFARDFEHNLQLYGGGDAGRIPFGMGPMVASLVLPRLSQIFINERPRLQLKVSVGPADQLVQELMRDEIEMLFANTPQVRSIPDVITAPIGRMRLAVIVRSAHPMAGRRRVTFSELAAFPAASAVELPTMGITGEAGAFICDNYHILRETVLGTDCLWVASPDFVVADIAEGRLCCLDVADLDAAVATSELSMARRRERTMSPAAEAVAAVVQALCS